MKHDDSLQYLEADMGLVCDGYHSHTCTAQAVYIVRIHLIDHCNRPKLAAGGDRVFLMCKACMEAIAWRLGEIVGEMYALLPDSGAETICTCATCGRRVLEMDDVMCVERLVGR